MIPIAKPHLGKKEAQAVHSVILTGWVTQGPKVKEFEEAFSSYVGSKHACAVSSCTAALHLALLTIGVKPGDVVITVSHSFIATANAIRHCGAEPVFVDIQSDTFNMSPECLEECLGRDCEFRNGHLFYRHVTELAVENSPLCYLLRKGKTGNYPVGRVAAIMPVHQMGMPCNMSAILELAKKYRLPVVEDAACALGSDICMNGAWEKIGKPHGHIACFSFHPRKVITTGDGGMLTTNNPDYDKKFRLLRQHGMSVSDVVRHHAKKIILEKYLTTGFNYRMTDIQAAVGIEQLKKIPKILKSYRKIDQLYRKQLKYVNWLQLPEEPVYARCNWQSYPVRLVKKSPLSRNQLMQYLLDNGISSRPGIMNAHGEKSYSGRKAILPESEEARKNVILLPIYHGLEEDDIKKITSIIKKL